jgi:AraC-like DNA-binding protein
MGFYNFLLLPSFISESLINAVDAFSFLTLSAFSDLNPRSGDPAPLIRMTGLDLIETDGIAERMEREFTRKEPGYRAALLGYMTVLFSKIFRKMSLPAETDAVRRNITPEIISYIESHLNEKLTLAELACRSFYNPSYFSRIFKEYSGQSLSDFIHRKRVERALELLNTTDLAVEQIGSVVGFSDKKQFYRQFKNYMGITPGAVRKTNPSD